MIFPQIRVYQNDADVDVYHSVDEQAQRLANLFRLRGVCHENRGYLDKVCLRVSIPKSFVRQQLVLLVVSFFSGLDFD